MQSEKNLLQTGLFKSRNSAIRYMLLEMIHSKQEPVGAWQLQEDLLKRGVQCSTASVGRLLRNLDYQEYTVRKSNQGRVLTPLGEVKLEEITQKIESVQRQNSFHESLKIHEYDELIDLLCARKVLETEAARQAALKGTKEDMFSLARSVNEHRESVANNQDPTETALNFHAVVAQISHNRFLKTLLDMLIYEEMKIESVMETLVTRERGQIYAVAHSEIAEAITRHDSDLAASLMEKHIQELSNAIIEQFKGDDSI